MKATPTLTATLTAVAMLLWPLACAAQQPAPKPPQPAPVKPPTTKTVERAPRTEVAPYRIEPLPAWVKPAPTPPTTAGPPSPVGWRYALVDRQVLLGDGSEQRFVRVRQSASQASALGEISKIEIYFNPAYQRLRLHELTVIRGGTRISRLNDTKVEMLRREQQLDRQLIDGVSTALLVVNDVRVDDQIEVAYTVDGANPIFKGRYADLLQVSAHAPVDLLQLRIDYPASRTLRVKPIRTDIALQESTQGNRRTLQTTRSHLPAVVAESQTPPWFKVYPALHVSEYASWAEVQAWARDLFGDATPSSDPALAAQVAQWRSSNLPPTELLDAVLTFVQEDVRYFSVSLGESSHRPKPPARTLADRVGDCKDKVSLLIALLAPLGIEARPALVSLYRNKGVVDYLPSHDQFDHVIAQVVLEGKTYWLDPTLTGQGRRLAQRGTPDYGVALVVGDAASELVPVVGHANALDRIEYVQHWNLADLRKPVTMTYTMRTAGIYAEAWRNAVARAGTERIAESLGGAYGKVIPGLRRTDAPKLRDDLDQNRLDLTLTFEIGDFGRYSDGSLEAEFTAFELLDVLVGPQELKRSMPYFVDQPRRVRAELRVDTPRPYKGKLPSANEVSDKHFLQTWRVALDGERAYVFTLDYERRASEVAPADLDSFRQNLQKARRLTSNQARVALIDVDRIRTLAADIDRQVDRQAGSRKDELREMLIRMQFNRLLATEALAATGQANALGARVLIDRAGLNNMLDAPAAGQRDADAALTVLPADSQALETRAMALLMQGQVNEATETFKAARTPGSRSPNATGEATALFYEGRYGEAVTLLRTAIDGGVGDEERDFALIWLYLAAERADGTGRAAIAPLQASVRADAWPGAILHFLGGTVTQDELLRLAAKDERKERLHLCEAYFFIGQTLLLKGQADDARKMFELARKQNALPYREHSFAQIELKRLNERR